MSVPLQAIRRKVIGDQLQSRLEVLAGVTVYRGEVPGAPPLMVGADGPDPAARVAPYVVLYTGAGGHYVSGEADVADTHDDLTAVHQVTCVTGYEADCAYLVDRVDNLLFRWSPTVEGLAFGRLRPPPGYDPGTPRRNETVSPPRFWVPLQYRLEVTT